MKLLNKINRIIIATLIVFNVFFITPISAFENIDLYEIPSHTKAIISETSITANTNTIYIKDGSNNYMSGVTVRFQDDLGVVYTGVTNSSGGVTLTKVSGREYGVTVYKDSYARQYLSTKLTYTNNDMGVKSEPI